MPARAATSGAPGVDRDRVLAYRAVAHDLVAPGTGAVVLRVGLQDYPPGRSALPALMLRTGCDRPRDDLALVHSVRGALHVHRAEDLQIPSPRTCDRPSQLQSNRHDRHPGTDRPLTITTTA